ncbi:hypothetical protein Bbelb_100270 [Branchiostoma belcheri]|nr:hypothetical protein Bbelb_100270 [Branchiostoma belcheri]
MRSRLVKDTEPTRGRCRADGRTMPGRLVGDAEPTRKAHRAGKRMTPGWRTYDAEPTAIRFRANGRTIHSRRQYDVEAVMLSSETYLSIHYEQVIVMLVSMCTINSQPDITTHQGRDDGLGLYTSRETWRVRACPGVCRKYRPRRVRVCDTSGHARTPVRLYASFFGKPVARICVQESTELWAGPIYTPPDSAVAQNVRPVEIYGWRVQTCAGLYTARTPEWFISGPCAGPHTPSVRVAHTWKSAHLFVCQKETCVLHVFQSTVWLNVSGLIIIMKWGEGGKAISRWSKELCFSGFRCSVRFTRAWEPLVDTVAVVFVLLDALIAFGPGGGFLVFLLHQRMTRTMATIISVLTTEPPAVPMRAGDKIENIPVIEDGEPSRAFATSATAFF